MMACDKSWWIRLTVIAYLMTVSRIDAASVRQSEKSRTHDLRETEHLQADSPTFSENSESPCSSLNCGDAACFPSANGTAVCLCVDTEQPFSPPDENLRCDRSVIHQTGESVNLPGGDVEARGRSEVGAVSDSVRQRSAGSDEVQCSGLRSKRYISDGFCRTLKPVVEVLCTGRCVPPRALPDYQEFLRVWGARPSASASNGSSTSWVSKVRGSFYGDRDLESRCVEGEVRNRRVRLFCDNGTTKVIRVKVVKSCACRNEAAGAGNRRRPADTGGGFESERNSRGRNDFESSRSRSRLNNDNMAAGEVHRHRHNHGGRRQDGESRSASQNR